MNLNGIILLLVGFTMATAMPVGRKRYCSPSKKREASRRVPASAAKRSLNVFYLMNWIQTRMDAFAQNLENATIALESQLPRKCRSNVTKKFRCLSDKMDPIIEMFSQALVALSYILDYDDLEADENSTDREDAELVYCKLVELSDTLRQISKIAKVAKTPFPLLRNNSLEFNPHYGIQQAICKLEIIIRYLGNKTPWHTCDKKKEFDDVMSTRDPDVKSEICDLLIEAHDKQIHLSCTVESLIKNRMEG